LGSGKSFEPVVLWHVLAWSKSKLYICGIVGLFSFCSEDEMQQSKLHIKVQGKRGKIISVAWFIGKQKVEDSEISLPGSEYLTK